jgi:predicted ribosomally synthesized peptide with nif11-like leader
VLLTGFGEWSIKIGHKRFQAMSEEQLSAFFEAVKADAALQEKLKGAADMDAAVAMAQEAGFDVSKADWLKHQANQTLELSDEELEGAAGGISPERPIVLAEDLPVPQPPLWHIILWGVPVR